MQITKLKENELPKRTKNSIVKVKEMGNIIEIQYTNRKEVGQTIQMLEGGDEFMICSTGEIKKVTHGTTRNDNKKGLYKTFANIRGLINTNITDTSKVRWCVLTYKENMTDTKRLYKDFDKFNKRFQYYCKKNELGKAEYIAVFEPQKRGAWHCHLLYIWENKAPFIPNEQFEKIWGHGFTQIKKLDNVDNVGAYLTAYLSDMDFSECTTSDMNPNNIIAEKIIIDENGKPTTKAVIKGARLNFYPANFQMIRHSKGLKKPIESVMRQEEANKLIKGARKTYERGFKFEEGNMEFFMIKQQFNTKKVKKAKKTGGRKVTKGTPIAYRSH